MLSLEKKYYVYALIDPINNLPFYFGKGCGDRAYSHLRNEKTNSQKISKIKNIRLLNLEPKVEIIISHLDEKTAYNIEYDFIRIAKLIYNIDLTNKSGLIMPPNRKGSTMSNESKLKISKALKGKKKQKMKDSTKKLLSEIHKNKIGPNKAFVDSTLLKKLYIDDNLTKIQICEHFNIGLGSLNRILKENSIYKTKECFRNYSLRIHNI